MVEFAWLIPVLPLAGFVLNGLFGNKLPKSLVGIVGSGTILASFIISVGIFLGVKNGPLVQHTIEYFTFIEVGFLRIPFEFLIDPLSAMMLLVITGVGFLIHLYSISYMHDDESFARYFAYLNLFVFFMLLLVLGANYVIMFIGWEGVGLCSYLLIGFWFKNHQYNDAAKKAFITTRIGDLGLLLGDLAVGAQNFLHQAIQVAHDVFHGLRLTVGPHAAVMLGRTGAKRIHHSAAYA